MPVDALGRYYPDPRPIWPAYKPDEVVRPQHKEKVMGLWLKLLQIWTVIQPFLNSTNWQQVLDLFHKAVEDFNGKNYAAVVNDLIAALKLIIPNQSNLLDAHAP